MKTSSPVGIVIAVVVALTLGAGALYWVRAGAPKRSAAAEAATTPTLAPSPSDAVAELWQAPLHDLTGKPHGLSAYKGHVLVVNFWASWCGPCVREMPLLTDLS